MTGNRTSRSILPLVLISAGLLLVLGAVVWEIKPFGFRNLAESSPQPERIPYPDIPRVSLGDAKAAYELGKAVFLDVRGEPYYSENHIPGALSITEEDLSTRLNELNPKNWIITYCT